MIVDQRRSLSVARQDYNDTVLNGVESRPDTSREGRIENDTMIQAVTKRRATGKRNTHSLLPSASLRGPSSRDGLLSGLGEDQPWAVSATSCGYSYMNVRTCKNLVSRHGETPTLLWVRYSFPLGVTV